MTIKILVADDESAVCEVVKLYLEQQGFIVYTYFIPYGAEATNSKS